MVTITIVNVPEGAEEDVKNMAMVAIERFLYREMLVVDEIKVKEFEREIDTIRTSNDVDAKFLIVEIGADE